MFSRLVRRAQLAELAACLALGTWLAAGRSWPLPSVAVLLLGIALGWRAAFVLASSFLGWWFRSPRPPEHRIGAWGAVRMVLGELRAFVMFNLVHVPWEAWVLRPDPEPAPTQGTPIVLVHGYFANRGYFAPLVRRLEAAGLGPVFAPNLRSWFAPIERFEEDLAAAVERIAAGTGRKVILVGHSMGGLGIRAYVARRGAGRVAKVITVASPHEGTAVAPLGLGENARQMRRGSPFLAALAAHEQAHPPPFPAVCYYTPHDNMVMPQAGSALPWARTTALPGFGHIALIESEALWRAMRPELATAA